MSIDLWREALAGARAEALGASLVTPDTDYQRDPIGWITRYLGIPERTIRWSLNPGYDAHAWDGTRDPMVVIAQSLSDWRDVGVESGTGTGKSFWVACLILWFMAAFKGARVFTFAPKEDQLRLYIWAEMAKLWPRFQARFPLAESTDLRIRMLPGSDEWGAWGYSVGVRADETVATRAAGMHAEHMLIVNEETPGQHPSVLAAQENTCTAPHNLRISIGNPDHQLDALHQFCTSPGVVHVRISALDHPNVVAGDESIVPGAVSRVSIDRRVAKYGTDNALFYGSRVRGLSPSEAQDALIKLDWIRACQALYRTPAYLLGPPALGVDVANSEAGDEGAIAHGQGRTCLKVESFPCPDANDLGLRVLQLMRDRTIEDARVGVDSVGVGAGTVNTLKAKDRYVQALNGGERAAERPGDEQYNNKRSQMYWQAREDIRTREIALPDDPELVEDLITPTWEPKNGKICVESKETIKDRLPGRRSTNKGDAFVYWNWVRSRDPVAHDLRARGKTLQEEVWEDALGKKPVEDYDYVLGGDQ